MGNAPAKKGDQAENGKGKQLKWGTIGKGGINTNGGEQLKGAKQQKWGKTTEKRKLSKESTKIHTKYYQPWEYERILFRGIQF